MRINTGDDARESAPFVNVDTTTIPGLQRATELGLAQSGLADAIVIRHIFEADQLFDPQHRGRLFAVFRHPVDRAISMFNYLKYGTYYLCLNLFCRVSFRLVFMFLCFLPPVW